MGKHEIEVFTAGCPPCKETLENVRMAVKEKGCGCEVIEQRCEGDECCAPAKKYGIKAVPTIVIDGQIAMTGKASIPEIKARL